MAASNALHLVWDNHLENVSSLFQLLYQDNKFVDVTIACRDGLLRAHKLILSACSAYFEKIFQENPCKHPVVIIRGVRYQEMKMILEYIYKGFIDIPASLLNNLICVASELEIKGFENFQNYQGAYQDASKTDDYSRLQANDDKNSRTDSGKKRNFNDDVQISSISYNSSIQQPLTKKRMVVSTTHNVDLNNSDDRRHQTFGDHQEPNTSTAEISSLEEFNYKDGIMGATDLPFKIAKVVAEKEWMENDESLMYEQRFSKNDDLDYIPNIKALKNIAPSGNEYSEFVCSLCFYKCHSRKDYLLHEKSHTKTEKPHKCEFCPSSFTRSSHLARHRRMHTGERPFNCLICEKSFARQDKLKQHVRTSHAQEGVEIPTVVKRLPEKIPVPTSIVIPQDIPTPLPVYQENSERQADQTNKVKRGRGRPRKYPLIPSLSMAPLGPKRGRGRPRKIKYSFHGDMLDNIKEECKSPKTQSEEDYSFEMSGGEHITIEPLIEINTETHQLNITPEEQIMIPNNFETPKELVTEDSNKEEAEGDKSVNSNSEENNEIESDSNVVETKEDEVNDFTVSIVN